MPANPRSLYVTEGYRARMVALRNVAQRAARSAWDAIQEADLDGTYAPPVDRIAHAQRDAARASIAYLQAFTASELGRRSSTPPVDAKPYVGQSWDGQKLEDALRSPLIGVKADIGRGLSPSEALRRGRSKISRNAGLDVDFVSRGALTDAMAASPHVQGWKRAVKGTCDACLGLADGSTLPPGTPLEVHPGCECVSEAVVRPPSPSDALREFNGVTLADEERGAVDRYVGSVDSFLVNRALRGQGRLGGRVQQIIDGLDGALEHVGALEKPVRVYRAIVGDASVFQRGLVMDEAGFGSTTASEKWVAEFLAQRPAYLGSGDPIVMGLDVDSRVKALWGANPSEDELLLQRGCRYVVESVEREGDTWHVRAKVLPPK